MVLHDGFAWNGERYTSLSTIAKAIAGTSWNGWRFFGIKRPAMKNGFDSRGKFRRPKPNWKGKVVWPVTRKAAARTADQKTFAAVKAQLAANNRKSRTRSRAKEPSLLAGLLADTTGNRLVASHAVKNGKRFHSRTAHVTKVVFRPLNWIAPSPKPAVENLSPEFHARSRHLLADFFAGSILGKCLRPDRRSS
jgi:hypothetical protein